ncbi:MAG: hypothetical protein Fur0037_17170 [Planctomycetota bacterium]
MRGILPSATRLLVASLASALAFGQTEGPILVISQAAIGSNGFGTSWRGQDVELASDAWLTRIAFQTGSATPQVDEIRLMTGVPSPVTIAAVTSLSYLGTEVEAVLAAPYLLRGGTRYSIWFHQNGTPRGTYGCNLRIVDPTWSAYHTNVDPTRAPGPGEPSYYWAYQYGTNVRLTGYDNLNVGGNAVPGGMAQFRLETAPFDSAILFFAQREADLSLPLLRGPLRLDPARILPAPLIGTSGPSGFWTPSMPIPNSPSLQGVRLRVQAAYDATFAVSAAASPLDLLVIQ